MSVGARVAASIREAGVTGSVIGNGALRRDDGAGSGGRPRRKRRKQLRVKPAMSMVGA